MKAGLFTLLLAGASLAAVAQCPVTVTKSGTGLTRTYTASSPASGMTYTWMQQGYAASSGSSVTRTYTYGGYYNVFVAGQTTSCIDSFWVADTVAGPINCAALNPSLYISGSATTYSFSLYGNYAPTPGYTLATSYSYGDGTSGSSPSHTYTANGTYTVTATLTYSSTTYPTCVKTASSTVSIYGVSCGTTITKSGTGLTRTYTAVHPNYSTAAWTHYWTLHPGYSYLGNTQTITKTYTYGGYYTVGMSAHLTSPVLCNDSAYVNDTVVGPMDCSSTSLSLADTGGTTHMFFPYSSATVAPGYAAVSYSYNYGDGTTGTSSTHTYAAPGTYTVFLTATWGAGATGYTACTKTITKTINISAGATMNCATAHAGFASTNSGATYTFSNTTTPSTPPTGVSASYIWTLNGITYTGSGNKTVTFSANGTYYPKLVVTWYETASGLYLCRDSSVVAVTVTAVPPPPNQIPVYVNWDSTYSLGYVPTVKVWLIKYDSSTQILSAVDSTTVTAGYSGYGGILTFFNNKPAGSYRVKAHITNQPSTATVALQPTYSYSSLYWNTATVYNHTGASTPTSCWLLAGAPVTGPGFIGGSVLTGANKGTGAGDPVAGQLILLRDKNGALVRSTYTDATGAYSFATVPTGEYTVYPEELNYATTPSATVSVTGFQNTKTGLNFRKNGNARTIVPAVSAPAGVAALSAGAVRIHPNPTTGLVTVQLAAAASAVTVRVTSVTGQAVYAQSVPAATAVKGWTLDLSELPAGIYNLNLTNAESSHTEKLVLQR